MQDWVTKRERERGDGSRLELLKEEDSNHELFTMCIMYNKYISVILSSTCTQTFGLKEQTERGCTTLVFLFLVFRFHNLSLHYSVPSFIFLVMNISLDIKAVRVHPTGQMYCKAFVRDTS